MYRENRSPQFLRGNNLLGANLPLSLSTSTLSKNHVWTVHLKSSLPASPCLAQGLGAPDLSVAHWQVVLSTMPYFALISNKSPLASAEE